MYAVTAAAHEPTCKAMVDLAREVGAPDELRELTQAEVRARCASPAFLAGAFMRDGASVQPGFLVRGLRRVVLERGVRIYEGTPVTGLKAGPPAVLTTPNGSLRARNVVLALNAWATGWPQLSRRLVAWSSYIVLTAPAPDRLAEIGWTGGELISDFRTSLRYFRTTRDGRIAFGGGGGRARRTIDEAFTHDSRAVEQAAEGFRLMFPTLCRRAHRRRLGRPHRRFTDPSAGVRHARAGQRLLRARLHGQRRRAVPPRRPGAGRPRHRPRHRHRTRLPMVNPRPRLFPPQPFRSWGAAVVRQAMIAKETAEEQGRKPGLLVSELARMPRRMGYLLGPD